MSGSGGGSPADIIRPVAERRAGIRQSSADGHTETNSSHGLGDDGPLPIIQAPFAKFRKKTDVKELHDRLKAYFSKATTMVNFALPSLFDYMKLSNGHASTTALPWGACAVAFNVFSVLSFLVSLVSSFSSGSKDSHVEWLCNMAYASAVLRMLAAFTLLLFYNVAVYIVIAPLIFSFAVLLFLLKRAWKKTSSPSILPVKESDSDDGSSCTELNHVNGAAEYWEPHGAQLKDQFDQSSMAALMGFTGLISMASGYSSPDGLAAAAGGGLKLTECFLFYGAAMGMVVELLASVPPIVELDEVRIRVVEVNLRVLAHVAVLFLLLAGLMAGAAVVQEHVLLAFATDVIVALLCFCYDLKDRYRDRKQEKRRKEDAKKRQEGVRKWLKGLHVAMFSALMALYSAFVGGGEGSPSSTLFKFFVGGMLCSILSYFTWVIVDDLEESKEFPRNAFRWATYVHVAITSVLFLLLAATNRNELWTILSFTIKK